MAFMNTLSQPRPSFKEQMHRAREDAIVEAACRLLGEKGFETMTVDEVACAVGIAKASLYKHFAGKDDLCAAAMVHVVGRLQRFLDELPEGLQALQRLQALLRWLLELQLGDETPLLPSRNSALAQALRTCDAYRASMEEVHARILGWIAEAQAAAQLRRELPPEVILCALLARSTDPMLAMLRERGHGDAQILDWAVATCLGGLVSAPAAPERCSWPAPGC
ncbi:TetR/AcrR family transcriptional regulator [Alicycliphilus denitrificans]|uniref:Regulatory protein TetR n=3 Tax=Alicycliphilus denitrificans TaxID=179636 RepID=F4GCT3_ALIDK|nr:TetR/AcrR family transcriptional regulator [Alicycliphilus denitrificans]ADU97893.1 regulatory protein TetR [Alicycliphilus denitrificans BC]AEB82536.1 regulatory protein TetR [Alicycliphilus denitrificans K601]QKD42220.1 TetR/AcrR family transcriptional regulator [Alicycliphilus denitrificans]GAO21060.1 TetR family transcriptional regulator [Alicycliphilus sp. B1]